MKKLIALLLAAVMVLSLAACGGETAKPTTGATTPTAGTEAPETEPAGPTYEKVVFDGQKYTYALSASVMPTNWNPHTYQTSDDGVPLEYVKDSLFTVFYNDELHPVEGKAPFEGYKIVPAMAADFPVDVTETVKAEHPEFNIPESATTGYAWSVKLRDDLKWDNGDPITAQDFVDSLERVLRGELLNYRAADYYDGTYAVVNADKYSLRGTTTVWDNGSKGFQIEEMEKNDEGQYTVDGDLVYIGVGYPLSWTSGNSLADYVDAYGDEFFGMEHWEELKGMMDEEGKVPATEETLELLSSVTTTVAAWGETDDDLFNYLIIPHTYDPEYSMESGVGLYVSGDNELTFVYRNAMDGFYLMTYGMNTECLVKTDLYDELLVEKDGVWSSTYGTSVETSASYGPYKISDYQMDKSMHFVKNENWYGWNSGDYTYVDPNDGKQYDMYQTTDIDLQYVKESATRKTMFLSGKLAGYGLQADDFDQYRSSEYCYATPGESVFGMILNGYMDMLKEREAAADFNQKTTDLEMMSVTAFKKALAVSIDRDDMCASISPARSAGLGLIGIAYVYDPETGARYRDSDQAKQTLCDFYSVDPADYGGDLDKAVAAITGFDPVAAGTLFKEAFDEGIELGYITDEDGDGICDQTVTMQYALGAEVDEFMEKTLAYLNESVSRAAEGTPFEGKIQFTFSAVLGNAWSEAIRNGTADVVLAGWSGATLDPFGFADTWTNDQSYWNKWFDATTVDVTIDIAGEDVTMTLRDWAECLNGTAKTVDGKDYNFGYGQVDVDTRLDILAACEKSVLGAYVTLPMLADGSMALLSQQLYYVVEDYNPIMGRGGIQYTKYNYSDTEWEQYVADQGGTLQY